MANRMRLTLALITYKVTDDTLSRNNTAGVQGGNTCHETGFDGVASGSGRWWSVGSGDGPLAGGIRIHVAC